MLRISLSKPRLSMSPRGCDWSDGAVLCDWSTAYYETPIIIAKIQRLETWLEKMVSIVPHQFKPESDDETVEVTDWQETDSQARMEQDVSQR